MARDHLWQLGAAELSAPTGLHEGVPVGVQIIAGPCREDLCFDVAAALEAHCPVAAPIHLPGPDRRFVEDEVRSGE